LAVERHAEQRVGCVELSEGEPVADAAPPQLPLEPDVEPFFRKEAALEGDDQRGRVDQVEEADAQRRGPGASRAGGGGSGHGQQTFRVRAVEWGADNQGNRSQTLVASSAAKRARVLAAPHA
jgi:hypothetical protein